jgi:hypothetical protein
MYLLSEVNPLMTFWMLTDGVCKLWFHSFLLLDFNPRREWGIAEQYDSVTTTFIIPYFNCKGMNHCISPSPFYTAGFDFY